MKVNHVWLLLPFIFLSKNAYALQCTEYVNQQLSANGFKTLKGNAIDFASSSKNSGIKNYDTPEAKRVIVFDGTRVLNGKKYTFSSVGHVGWVTSVSGSNMKFSDANWNFDGKVLSHSASKYNSNWKTIKVDGGASYYNIKSYVVAPIA